MLCCRRNEGWHSNSCLRIPASPSCSWIQHSDYQLCQQDHLSEQVGLKTSCPTASNLANLCFLKTLLFKLKGGYSELIDGDGGEEQGNQPQPKQTDWMHDQFTVKYYFNWNNYNLILQFPQEGSL